MVPELKQIQSRSVSVGSGRDFRDLHKRCSLVVPGGDKRVDESRGRIRSRPLDAGPDDAAQEDGESGREECDSHLGPVRRSLFGKQYYHSRSIIRTEHCSTAKIRDIGILYE